MMMESVVVGAIVGAVANFALEKLSRLFGKEKVYAVARKANNTFKNLHGPGADSLRKAGAKFFETLEAGTIPAKNNQADELTVKRGQVATIRPGQSLSL